MFESYYYNSAFHLKKIKNSNKFGIDSESYELTFSFIICKKLKNLRIEANTFEISIFYFCLLGRLIIYINKPIQLLTNYSIYLEILK